MPLNDKDNNVEERKTKGRASPVDAHVGGRLRMRRTLLGLSQEKLAEAIGLTFQQVQKYELGRNRVSASRLYEFSKILDVPVSFFFDEYDAGNQDQQGMAPLAAQGMAENQQDHFMPENVMQDKETLDLIRVYYSISDPKLRKDLMKFLKQMTARMKDE